MWLASTIAALGDYFRLFAIPLLVFSLTGSALNTGATLAVETAPYLLVSPFAGVLADRISRRTVMIAAEIAQLIIIGSLPAAHYAGVLSLAQIFAVGFAAGAVEVVFGGASLSAIPNLIPAEKLVTANSALQLSFSVSALAGPALAGAVVGATGQPAVALAVDAGAQLVAAGILVGIRRPLSAARTGPTAASVLADIRQGFAYLWRHPLLRASALLLFSFNVMLGGTLGQLVVFGSVALHLRGLPLSLLYSAEAAGGAAGALLAGRIGRRWPFGRTVLVALPIAAASGLGLSVAPDLAAACAALAVMGLTEMIMFINLVALRQRIVPDQLQGRVNATGRALAVSGAPVGALLIGILVGPLGGVRPALAVLGGIVMVNAAAAMFTPLRPESTSRAEDVIHSRVDDLGAGSSRVRAR